MMLLYNSSSIRILSQGEKINRKTGIRVHRGNHYGSKS
jgi:hypothetical protein